MPKGKAKSKFNYEKDPKTGREIGCIHESSGWCYLPKGKRCKDVLPVQGGGKACELEM